MFARISALLAVVVAVATSARMERHVHVRRDSPVPRGMCDTGAIKCCNNFMNASSIQPLLDELSMEYEASDNVGIDCTPLNFDGAGQGASCQQQPVCCANNTYKGFVNVGCSPMDFN